MAHDSHEDHWDAGVPVPEDLSIGFREVGAADLIRGTAACHVEDQTSAGEVEVREGDLGDGEADVAHEEGKADEEEGQQEMDSVALVLS